MIQQMNIFHYYKFRIMFMTFLIVYLAIYLNVPNVTAYGQSCNAEALSECGSNEKCSSNNSSSICQCLFGFTEYAANKTCIPEFPDHPDDNSSGLAVGLTIIFVVMFSIALVAYLHYKYRLLSPVVRKFNQWRYNRRGTQAFEVTEDLDDVNPIV